MNVELKPIPPKIIDAVWSNLWDREDDYKENEIKKKKLEEFLRNRLGIDPELIYNETIDN